MASSSTKVSPEIFYEKMFLIRKFEERVLQLFSEGRLFGTAHTYIGQEANAVGVLQHLEAKDIVFSNHRSHGHYLAYSDDADGLMAELMGKETGVCGGKGGSQHLCSGNFYSNGVLGGTVPCAVGMALAEKLKGAKFKAVVFLGDGALGEGVVYESLNIASLWSVPILFVIENNFYAQSTPSHLQIAGKIASRPRAFGIQTVHKCPTTVEEVYELTGEAFSYIDKKAKPFCLVLDTYRFSPHSKSDDHRPVHEIELWRERDPLQRLGDSLTHSARKKIEREAIDRIERAINKADEAAFPGANVAF